MVSIHAPAKGATVGFRAGGSDYLMYNQFDSYPTGNGATWLKEYEHLVATYGATGLKSRVLDLKRVSADTPVPEEDQERLLQVVADYKATWNAYHEGGAPGTYWSALCRTGSLIIMIEAGVVMSDGSFMADSLFNEYSYIFNLDDGILELYHGFVKTDHALGRYAGMATQPDAKYKPVALYATMPLDAIPDDWTAGADAGAMLSRTMLANPGLAGDRLRAAFEKDWGDDYEKAAAFLRAYGTTPLPVPEGHN